MGQNESKYVGSGSNSNKLDSREYGSECPRGNGAAKKDFETERNKEINFKKRLVSKSNESPPIQNEEMRKNEKAEENIKRHKKKETIKRQEVDDGISKENNIFENENKTIVKTENTDSHMVDRKDCVNEFDINIAIDIGTIFTGFAFSFRNNKNHIETGQWKLGKSRITNVVLLKPHGAVDSMGVKADRKFAYLVVMKKMKGYRLFRHFKMALYAKDNLTLDEAINDTDGKPMLAIQLFQAVISYMKDCAIEMVNESLLGGKERIDENILWILTIPVIWPDSACQFMHEAAVGAGINKKQLRIVLEQDAASAYCRKHLLFMTETLEVEKLPAGIKYILADLGGGTVDICSHEIMTNDCEGSEKIRELFRATVRAFGGTFVDNKFVESMMKVFGKYTWEYFKRNHFDDYLHLVNGFVDRKLTFDYCIEEIIITIPRSLIELLQITENCTLKERIERSMYSTKITVKKDKLICKRALFEEFFEASVQGILLHLKRILSQCKDEYIDVIFLVGGFAESQYVKETLIKEMEKLNVRVIVAQDPWLAVMKGAVMLGYDDRTIMQRRSKFTYDFNVGVPFVEGRHPEELKFLQEGKSFYGNIFEKMIEKDQNVEYNQEFKTSLSSEYASERKPPTYCTKDMECNEIGKIVKPPPPEGWPDLIFMNMNSILL